MSEREKKQKKLCRVGESTTRAYKHKMCTKRRQKNNNNKRLTQQGIVKKRQFIVRIGKKGRVKEERRHTQHKSSNHARAQAHARQKQRKKETQKRGR
jgi:hypothetical protein